MAKIVFEDEIVEVTEKNRVDEITTALRFKAEHIKAKADPEIFTWAADMIDELFDAACEFEETIKRLEAEAASRYD